MFSGVCFDVIDVPVLLPTVVCEAEVSVPGVDEDVGARIVSFSVIVTVSLLTKEISY